MAHKRKGKFYLDKFICPKCGNSNNIFRYSDSAGKMTLSFCRSCKKTVKVMAGAKTEESKVI